MWDVIKQDAITETAGEETTDSFSYVLCKFIATHATVDDQHELVQQLTNAKKPREFVYFLSVFLLPN